MVTQQQTLILERILPAAPAEIFRNFTKAQALRQWSCDAAEVDARPGGRVYLWWNVGYYASGIFTEVVPGARLAFSWQGRGEPGETVVQVACAAHPAGTAVTITHGGLGNDAAWTAAAQQIRRGWETALENLQGLLETGVDQRIARRPMFGLSGGDELTAELAAQLGVPVTAGIRIAGLLAEMGAAQAGLQKDDVVVSVGGHALTTWPSFAAAMQAHRAGDQVSVIFYRGPERHTVAITLSRRPQQEVPATAGALAVQARAIYATLDQELAACFAGVPEEAAGRRPAPEEWSAKEVVAHLIACERDMQYMLSEDIEDADVEQAFRANAWPRVQGLVAAYPRSRLLLEELSRNEAATVAMIELLPVAVAARKDVLHRLGIWAAGDALEHAREHCAEIRRALLA
ncbi:MAG TPA: SRPBCC domain-containing protein [Chloroflexia bacterium]|nr:SRPBCC domain-containing protein [Chloroflexia bacterium]